MKIAITPTMTVGQVLELIIKKGHMNQGIIKVIPHAYLASCYLRTNLYDVEEGLEKVQKYLIKKQEIFGDFVVAGVMIDKAFVKEFSSLIDKVYYSR